MVTLANQQSRNLQQSNGLAPHDKLSSVGIMEAASLGRHGLTAEDIACIPAAPQHLFKSGWHARCFLWDMHQKFVSCCLITLLQMAQT